MDDFGFNLSTEILIPVLLALFGLLTAAITYDRQKKKDLEEALKKEKRDAFNDFVRSLDRMINHHVLGANTDQAGAILAAKENLNTLYLRTSPDLLKLFVGLMGAARLLSNILDDVREGRADAESSALEDRKLEYNVALRDAVNGARREFGMDEMPVDGEDVEVFIL